MLAVGVSLALHAGGVMALYTMNWDTPMEEATVEPPRPTIIFQRWEKPQPEPAPQKPTNTPRASTATPPADQPFLPIPGQPAQTAEPAPNNPFGEGEIFKPADPPIELPPAVITKPEWITRPNATQLRRAYPRRAADRGVGGEAVLNCVVNASGAVSECAVVSESPSSFGFGDAAIKLSRHFKMKPQTADGLPVDGARVAIPLKFNIAQ